jgi:hypothetical protein
VIRVVLAVCVATALLAASLPAVEDARTDRTASDLDRTGDRLVRAAGSLHAADAPNAGASRIVRLNLPPVSLGRAGVESVVVDCEPRCAFRYRLGGGRTEYRLLAGVPMATPDGPVTFASPGPHRLRLGLVREDGGLVVTVRG